MIYADVNRLVLSRDLKVPIVSADLVDGDRELQTVGAAIENDLSANELMSGDAAACWRSMNAKSLLAGDISLLMQKILVKFKLSHPQQGPVGAKYTRWEKFVTFDK